VQRPPPHAAAAHVAGSEDDVGASPRGGDEAWEVGRVVGQVGVHLDDQLRAGRQRLAEAGEVGAAEAVLARAVQDADVAVVAGELVGQLAGAVGRGVVDDEHGGVDGRSAGREGGSGAGHDRREVLAFVEGRQDDPGGPHDGSSRW
jgi:hypothetical protein